MPSDSKPTPTAEPNPLLFIKEVAKYFMDFLETDFHKQRAPKRSVRFKDFNSLLIGVNLKKYSSFVPKIWYAINHAFKRSLVNEIGRGAYRTEIPRGLLELVRLQIEKISPAEISNIISSTADEISDVAVSHAKEYDKALSMATETASMAIQKHLVVPLISNVEKPIQNLELGDDNRIFLMQEELTAVLAELLNNKISELLRLTIGKQQTDLIAELNSVFELTEVKAKVLGFFESYKVGDLFLELFEMERNKKILDKQELYLYFCDIQYDNVKYPIFYIPFNLAVEKDSLTMEFDAQ